MNSKTLPFAVMLVTGLIVCGGLIYICLQGTEEITVEIDASNGIHSGYRQDVPSVGGKILFTYTSNKEDSFIAGYPDIVFEKDGVQKRFSVPEKVTWTSGKPISVYLHDPTGVPFDIDGWSYHFEISQEMKLTGNYKLIEVN